MAQVPKISDSKGLRLEWVIQVSSSNQGSGDIMEGGAERMGEKRKGRGREWGINMNNIYYMHV